VRPARAANVIGPDEYMYHADGRYEWSPERYAAALNLALRDLRWAMAQPWCRGVVMLVGVQGSGKSTFVEASKRADCVYLDDTFTDPALRARFIAAARQAGKPIECVYLNEPLEVCLTRNEARPAHRRIREIVIRDEHALLVGSPPSVAEGFDSVRALC
jgi:predicted kinase